MNNGEIVSRVRIEKLEGHDNAPFAPGFVSFPDLGLSSAVMFLVDTGNSHTALGESDARKIGLEPRDLPTPSTTCLGVGGRGNIRECQSPVIVCLVDTDNKLHEVSIPEINILLDFVEEQHSGGRKRKITHPYPSLLGRDFFVELDATLKFDFKKWDMWIEF